MRATAGPIRKGGSKRLINVEGTVESSWVGVQFDGIDCASYFGGAEVREQVGVSE